MNLQRNLITNMSSVVLGLHSRLIIVILTVLSPPRQVSTSRASMPLQFTMGEQPSKTVSSKHLAPKVELFDITWRQVPISNM